MKFMKANRIAPDGTTRFCLCPIKMTPGVHVYMGQNGKLFRKLKIVSFAGLCSVGFSLISVYLIYVAIDNLAHISLAFFLWDVVRIE